MLPIIVQIYKQLSIIPIYNRGTRRYAVKNCGLLLVNVAMCKKKY